MRLQRIPVFIILSLAFDTLSLPLKRPELGQ